jgi:hypothetical protein
MSRLLLIASLAVCGCSSAPTSDEVTFPDAPLTTLTSDDGAFTVELRTWPDQPPSRGVDAAELTVRDKHGALVDGLAIDVVPWMPDMGHGISTKPSLTAEGNGRYVAQQIAFIMPGRWELRTTLKGAVEERVTPTFEIP